MKPTTKTNTCKDKAGFLAYCGLTWISSIWVQHSHFAILLCVSNICKWTCFPIMSEPDIMVGYSLISHNHYPILNDGLSIANRSWFVRQRKTMLSSSDMTGSQGFLFFSPHSCQGKNEKAAYGHHAPARPFMLSHKSETLAYWYMQTQAMVLLMCYPRPCSFTWAWLAGFYYYTFTIFCISS